MKLLLPIAIIIFFSCQPTKDLYPTPDTIIKDQLEWQKDFYFKRIAEFKKQPIGYDKIVFLGNSITKGGGDWNEKLNTKNIVNRGISGDYTDGVLMRLDEIIHYKPIAVFIMIGVNDFWNDNSGKSHLTPQYVATNVINICKNIKKISSSTEIFIQTILPVNNKQYLNVKKVDYNFLKPNYSPTVNEQIIHTNTILKNNKEFEVIDLHPLFLNNELILNSSLSSDGIHINDSGYQVWIKAIKAIIENLNK
tara:strand:- start:174 stop:923 length:750 start_codon:yes stop_codon:yes gene_type:complete